MRKIGLLAWLGMVPVLAGEMPEKAASYHAALVKRRESAQLFERFRDAWLEERSIEDLEKELLSRAAAGEAGAWATLGRAYLAAGKCEQALEAFDKARKQSPAAWLDLETARLRLAAKDFAAAEKDALAVPEGDRLRLDALKLAGLACLRAERIDDALAHWTPVMAAAPGDHDLLEDLTELTRREGRFDLALDYCGKWRDATPDAYGKAMATLRRSELLLGSKRFDEAMAELSTLLKASGSNSWLERETLARAEQAHRQRGNAIGWAAWIGAWADAEPARLGFRRAQADALAAVGKTDEALATLTEVMKRSPGDMGARWQRVGLLERSLKLSQAYDECVELAAREKSESAGLRLADLAFRLEKKVELKQALDGVLAAADPAKRLNLAALYARYGLPEESERIWRTEASGEQGGQALRQLARQLQTVGRQGESIETWKQLGAREVAQDRIDAAQMLAGAGERGAARTVLTAGREKFSAEPGYEAALAELEMADDKPDAARAIYLKLARSAKSPGDLATAARGWLRTLKAEADPLKDLGDETADRCLRAAWLAAAGRPLPAISEDDKLELAVRLAILREGGRWPEVVAMMEATPGESRPLFLNELAEAKSAAGDFEGALATARQWRERVPEQVGPWLFEAGTLEKLHRQDDAAVLLRRAAARFEDNEDVAGRLFANLQDSPDPHEAIEWAWKRHDRSKDEAARTAWLREIVRVSKDRNQLGDLKDRFEERARRDPASPGPLIALAELAKARGDSQAMMDFLSRAAVNEPQDIGLISDLAVMEENMGETDRALDRYATLARLAPGPESAQKLANAKIRLGDIEGGMRDLQALAGEKGIDPLALEETADRLAAAGYVEEAARVIAAVEPARRTDRLDFMLGMLLDCDGREQEAADAFIRVLSEPDDPAERALQTADEPQFSGGELIPILQSDRREQQAIPGAFNNIQMASSQAGAKDLAKNRLSRLAIGRDGEMWERVTKVIPRLAVATPDEWRQARDFALAGGGPYDANWWDFLRDRPDNPLAVTLLLDSHQFSYGSAEQVADFLKRDLSLRTRLTLRVRSGSWLPDNLEFLESIGPEGWQDTRMRVEAFELVKGMFARGARNEADSPVSLDECVRGFAVVAKAGLADIEPNGFALLKTRLALLKGDADEIVKTINSWPQTFRNIIEKQSAQLVFAPPLDAFELWRQRVGDDGAEAAIEKLDSPVLRCQLSHLPEPGQLAVRLNRELANLPKDATPQTRRALIRMKWSGLARDEGETEALRKELENAATDESDPQLAMDAMIRMTGPDQNGRSPEDPRKLLALKTKLQTSPDPDDRKFVAPVPGYFSSNSSGSLGQTPPQMVFGRISTYGNAAGSVGQVPPQPVFRRVNRLGNRTSIPIPEPVLAATADREQSVRRVARYLEAKARACIGNPELLRDDIAKYARTGMLKDALDRICLPADAGLGRRMALLTLLDACSEPERARALVAEIAKSRPWETRWTVDLALRLDDHAEMRRLLDSVAERGDFDLTVEGLLLQGTSGKPATGLLRVMRLTRLANWAPQAKGHRSWMETAITMVADKADQDSRECFHRYAELMLDDPRLGEVGFRMIFDTRSRETPEVIGEAARRAILSGSYTSGGRDFATNPKLRGKRTSALEHLVRMARELGDEAAFPAGFLEKLKAVDPESEAWVGKLLAAKTVAELPDAWNLSMGYPGWVTFVRREAVMLRAVKMPGRDAWLNGIFRDHNYSLGNGNFDLVVRESLLEAEKAGQLEQRMIDLLEAAAGSHESWDQSEDSKQPLASAAELLLRCAQDTDAATLLGVIQVVRETKALVGDVELAFINLGRFWKAEMSPPRGATIAELLGSGPDAAYTLGLWRMTGGIKPEFVWGLPIILQNAGLPGRSEAIVAAGEDDPAFIDLFQAWTGKIDRIMQRRLVLKAAPDLAKLPAGIRSVVNGVLTEGMSARDLEGLEFQASAQLKDSLEARRKRRIVEARQSYQTMMSRPSSPDQSYLIGVMLGSVSSDDEAFESEVLAAWLPKAEADKSDKEFGLFLEGLFSHSARDSENFVASLRLFDSLTKEWPSASARNTDRLDLMAKVWSQLETLTIRDPALWQGVAALSPIAQAQFWLGTFGSEDQSSLAGPPKLLNHLREVTKNSVITRTALEWLLQRSKAGLDPKSKIDGTALLDFAKALKDAGCPPECITALLCQGCGLLPRMENPAAAMAAIPELLDAMKTLPEAQGDALMKSVQNLWLQEQVGNRTDVLIDRLKLTASPVHPSETASMLKFIITRRANPSNFSSQTRTITQMVSVIGDDELTGLWLEFYGKAPRGDLTLIVLLMEKDRVAEALELAPSDDQGFPFESQFTSRIAPLVDKLRAIGTPQSFHLMARLSLLPDATGAQAPAEKREIRLPRIKEEFIRIHDRLPPADRADLCLALGYYRAPLREQVPLLDEFANEAGAGNFQKLLSQEGHASALARLYIPAVCSRVNGGDLSGIIQLTSALTGTPPNRHTDSPLGAILPSVQASLADYIDRADGKLSEASTDAILNYATGLAGHRFRSFASLLIHLACPDAASLEAALKRCGVQGIKPEIVFSYGFRERIDDETMQSLFRLALLRQASSQALLNAFGKPGSNNHSTNSRTSPMLASLREPKLRAGISPALFLAWNGHLKRVSPENLEALNLYASERRNDFSEAQSIELDSLLKRLETAAKPMDPAGLQEPQRNQQKMERNNRGEESKRRIQDFKEAAGFR